MSKLTAAFTAVAVVATVSVVAVHSKRWMNLLIGDLSLLQRGQWWRAFTPVLVQPSGIFALVFLVLGAVVLLPALLTRFEAFTVLAAALVAGLGCLALNQWREPTMPQGGSSDLIAAMVGLWTVSLTRPPNERGSGRPGTGPSATRATRWPVLATAYAVFFAVYLVLLPTSVGRWAALVADVAVAAAVTATMRWRSGPRWVALSVGVCALVMAAQLDDHGLGILIGALAGIISMRWYRLRPCWRAWVRPALGLAAVAGIWLTWTALYGVALQVNSGSGVRQVGLTESLITAALALAVTSIASHLNNRSRRPRRLPLAPACGGVAALSCFGPLTLAANDTAAFALITLHLAVGGAALWVISGRAALLPRPSPSPGRRPTG